MAVPTTSRASTSELTLRLRKFAQAAGRLTPIKPSSSVPLAMHKTSLLP